MGMLGTGLPVSMYTTKTPIDMWRFNVPQLKEFLTFSVNDRYQLNYFICITERLQCIDNYFFKIKIVFYRLYLLRQHHERKTIFLGISLLSDIQWGTEPQHLLCCFLGVSILQLSIFYRVYDYDMLTLSQ
jgi:hypothetical protein